MRSHSAEAWAELVPLIEAEGPLALLAVSGELAPPDSLSTVYADKGLQMVSTQGLLDRMTQAEPVRAGGPEILRLVTDDVAEMMALVELTNPGPFRPRTIELGEYIGIRENGQLAAMSGERMRFGRFVEVSAVCVHPDHRGKGYAQVLMTKLMRTQVAQGLVPILHVYAGNSGAIALYEKLGFAIRAEVRVTVLELAQMQGN
jgi:predicted GNAT family acetyltransferase